MRTPRRLAALTVLLAATLGSTRAFADEASIAPTAPSSAMLAAPSREAPKAASEWYGYQTLGADGLALGVGALAPSSGRGFAYAAIGTYLVGAPVVHVLNGNAGVALGDLGLRAGAPLAGALVGGLVAGLAAPKSDSVRGLSSVASGMAYGLLAGFGLAVAIDALVLARRDVTPETAAPRAAKAVQMMPTVAPTTNGASAGVVGTF
jgi:hypothetical protein